MIVAALVYTSLRHYNLRIDQVPSLTDLGTETRDACGDRPGRFVLREKQGMVILIMIQHPSKSGGFRDEVLNRYEHASTAESENRMAKSMTGYGRAEIVHGARKFVVEIKSVNNRYLDVSIRMPRLFNPLEARIRQELKNYCERGKVDVYITFQDTEEAGGSVRYNRRIAEQYVQHIQEIAQDFDLMNELTAEKLSQYPDVFTMEEEQQDAGPLWDSLKEALDAAGEKFAAARYREGEFLKEDLLKKLDGMKDNVAVLTKRAPEIVTRYQEQLYEKVKALVADTSMDDSRILQEVAVYSDKVCIDEELTRLRSHIEATQQELQKEGPIGRKLDFLAQELNREANTILSKTVDAASSDIAIELKTTIEKIREQIQNLE